MLNGFRALDVAIKSAHDNATAQCKKEKETKMHFEDNMKFWQRVGQRMIAKIMSNPSDEVNGGTKAACNTKFGTAECILDPITECKYSELGKRRFCLPIKEAPIDKIFLAPRCDLRTTMGRVQDNIEAWLRTGMFGQHCLSKPNINIASPGGAGGRAGGRAAGGGKPPHPDRQVVGRLVEQQQVGLREDGGGEGGAHAPAARERAHLPFDQLRREAQIAQQRPRALLGRVGVDELERALHVDQPLRLLGAGLVDRGELGGLGKEEPPLDVRVHHVLRRRPAQRLLVELHLLRHVMHGELRRDVAHGPPRNRAQQRGLALAVAADEAVDAPAHERERRVLEQVHPTARIGQREGLGLDRARVSAALPPQGDRALLRRLQRLLLFSALRRDPQVLRLGRPPLRLPTAAFRFLRVSSASEMSTSLPPSPELSSLKAASPPSRSAIVVVLPRSLGTPSEMSTGAAGAAADSAASNVRHLAVASSSDSTTPQLRRKPSSASHFSSSSSSPSIMETT